MSHELATSFSLEDHRRMGIDLFNHVWTLLEKPDRTRDEDDAMLHAAHASRFHWGQVGTLVNLARGEWQISRVYAVLGRAEPALWHAQRCLDHCLAGGIGDFDLGYAHEALARAHRLAGDSARFEEHVRLARAAGERIAEDDDRDIFMADLATLE